MGTFICVILSIRICGSEDENRLPVLAVNNDRQNQHVSYIFCDSVSTDTD